MASVSDVIISLTLNNPVTSLSPVPFSIPDKVNSVIVRTPTALVICFSTMAVALESVPVIFRPVNNSKLVAVVAETLIVLSSVHLPSDILIKSIFG